MILAIDTVDKTCAVGILKGACPPCFARRCGRGKTSTVLFQSRSKELLDVLEKFLAKEKVKIEDIKGIAAYLGPGESFTGTRVGIAVANALSFALDMPTFGYCHIPEQNVEKRITQLLERSKNIKKFVKQVLTPVYARGANIT